jgi:HEAT repeat protein
MNLRTLLTRLTVALCALLVTTPATARKRPGKGPKAEPHVTALAECGAKRDSACIREHREALESIGTKACPALVEGLTSVAEAGQTALADAMVAIKCTEIKAVAEAAFKNTDADNRGPLAVAFAQSKNVELLPAIQELVKSGRPYDRERGCEALAILGNDDAVPTLVDAAGHGLYSVRQQAARALGSFQGEAARNALGTLVTTDSNIGVRIEAAKAIGSQKDKLSVPALIKGLGDSSGPVKTAVHKAIIDVTGLDIGMDPEAWEKWWQKNQPAAPRKRW